MANYPNIEASPPPSLLVYFDYGRPLVVSNKVLNRPSRHVREMRGEMRGAGEGINWVGIYIGVWTHKNTRQSPDILNKVPTKAY